MSVFQRQTRRFSGLSEDRLVFLNSRASPPSDGVVFVFAAWSSPAVAALRVLGAGIAERSDTAVLHVCDAEDPPGWISLGGEGKGETLGFVDGEVVTSLVGYTKTKQKRRVAAFLDLLRPFEEWVRPRT